MKVYLVNSTQTSSGETTSEIFKDRKNAVKYMEDLTGASEKEWRMKWDDDYMVYDDAGYFECVATIEEKEIK